ncbi:hypothetical protein M758_1G002600 [Ceratodon purpureus]|nr:hypothetical protein M758_1G002600 [Ceratodon purpureus]
MWMNGIAARLVCSGGGARKAVVWQQLRGLGFWEPRGVAGRRAPGTASHRIASHRIAWPFLACMDRHGSWIMDHAHGVLLPTWVLPIQYSRLIISLSLSSSLRG